MKIQLLATSFVALVLCAPAVTHGATRNEINYGSLKEQYGDTLLLEYKGPAGTTYYTCTTENKCKSKGKTMPNTTPPVLGSYAYTKSTDGTLAVKQMQAGTNTFYFLYDISGTKAKKITQIPFTKAGVTVKFSKNNNAVVFQEGSTRFTRYDIATKKISSVQLGKELAFFLISPNATYVTGYNYNTNRHELWRFSDGKMTNLPSSMQSYVEFSEDESLLAFLDDVKGFRTLYTMKASDLGKSSTPSLKQLTKPNTETEDYLFVKDTLYFMANVKGPLNWDLFKYNGVKTIAIDSDVSYGDFMKLVRTDTDSYLAYLKTEGKNTNIVLYSEDDGTTTLTPVKASPVSDKITREIKVYGKRTGVLLSPKKVSTKGANLIIWMHGGPQRQVAVGYHPYLSYAVYDEMLERLADAGNYVYKIDYTGSTGYGSDFRKALSMKIGDIEMKDIRNAIADIQKDKKIDKVYLIGNSYGGYMALRGIVDMPKTLDGVVSINGVSDWYGLIQQIPSSPFKDLFNGVPDTHNLDEYYQASVFTGMEDLTKDDKVLVVWGEKDSTVPVWQSTKYVEFANTKKNVNLSTLIFPNEEHILRSRKTLDTLCERVSKDLGIRNVKCKI